MPDTNPLRDHPNLTLHLSDATLLPIVSSNSSKTTQKALVSLTSTYLTVHEIASGLGLGTPQRLTVETDSAIGMVQSYIPPASTRPARHDHDLQSTKDAKPANEVTEEALLSPALVTTVLTRSRSEIEEARKAVQEMEKIGRGFQRAWVYEHKSGDGDEGQA